MELNELASDNIEDILPLNNVEKVIYSQCMNNHENYRQVSLILKGYINIDLVQKTWDLLVETNEVLRSKYKWETNDKSKHIILKNHRIFVNYFDLSYLDEGRKELELKYNKQLDINKINLKELLRITVCKLNVDKFEMIISNHSILYDDWSNEIILNEFITTYNNLYEGKIRKHNKTKYKEAIQWNNTKNEVNLENFWKKYLDDIVIHNTIFQETELKSKIIEKQIFKLSHNMLEKLKRFARNENISLKSLLYGAWAIILQRFNNNDSIIFGTVTSGRLNKKAAQVVGLFANAVPLKIKMNESDSISVFLAKVDGLVLERKSIETIPSNINLDYIFQCVVNIRESFLNIDNKEHILVESYNEEDNYLINKCNLYLKITTSNIIELVFRYNNCILSKDLINRLGFYFEKILGSIIADKNLKVNKINFLSNEEKFKLINGFNNTYTDYPKKKTIKHLFEEQVKKNYDKVAIVYEHDKISYGELNIKANQLANTLKTKGVGKGSIVGIMVDRSTEMMVGIIGILKTGAAYLPLDSEYPVDRINYMIKDSKVHILITQKKLLNKVEFNGEKIDIEDRNIYIGNGKNLKTINESSDLAQILYTSGTTGQPKGVMIEHRNVIRLVKNTDYVNFEECDRILQIGSLSFDASTFEIWGALLNGASLYIENRNVFLDAERLSDSLNKNNTSILLLTSALFNQLSNENVTMFQNLKYLLIGGDKLSPKHVNAVRKVCNKVIIVNAYGPTENGTISTALHIEKEYSYNIPIGSPISNSTAYIFDKYNNLSPIGAYGELCVGGEGLARGYLNKPELTQEKFIKNPFVNGETIYKTGDMVRRLSDGKIEFIGRIDNQVKIRGFRVELNEIEKQLLNINGVQQAVVIIKEDNSRNKNIYGYIVANRKFKMGELKETLKKNLPKHMIPSYLIQLENMPLTPNGKVDKHNLPEITRNFITDGKYIAPINETEKKIVDIWKSILEIEIVGVNDDFFELGGNSLLIIRLQKCLNDNFGITIPVADLYRYSTVKLMSTKILENTLKTCDFSNIEDILQKKFGKQFIFKTYYINEKKYIVLYTDADKIEIYEFLLKSILPKDFPHFIKNFKEIKESYNKKIQNNDDEEIKQFVFDKIKKQQILLNKEIQSRNIIDKYEVFYLQNAYITKNFRNIININIEIYDEPNYKNILLTLEKTINLNSLLRSVIIKEENFNFIEYNKINNFYLDIIDLSKVSDIKKIKKEIKIFSNSLLQESNPLKRILYNILIIKKNEKDYDILFSIDHNICDAASKNILMLSFFNNYNGLNQNQESIEKGLYKDYISSIKHSTINEKIKKYKESKKHLEYCNYTKALVENCNIIIDKKNGFTAPICLQYNFDENETYDLPNKDKNFALALYIAMKICSISFNVEKIPAKIYRDGRIYNDKFKNAFGDYHLFHPVLCDVKNISSCYQSVNYIENKVYIEEGIHLAYAAFRKQGDKDLENILQKDTIIDFNYIGEVTVEEEIDILSNIKKNDFIHAWAKYSIAAYSIKNKIGIIFQTGIRMDINHDIKNLKLV